MADDVAAEAVDTASRTQSGLERSGLMSSDLAPSTTALSGPATATSPSGRELQQRAVRTREKILHAAAHVFYSEGYAAATIGNIADRARVTKGALYFHYPSKAILATAVLHEHHAAWARIQSQSEHWDLTALEKIGALIHAVAGHYTQSAIARAGVRLGNEHHAIDAALPPPFIGWISNITNLVQVGHRDGSITTDIPADTAARTIVASFYGVQEVSERLHQRADLDQRITEWWDILSAAFRPKS